MSRTVFHLLYVTVLVLALAGCKTDNGGTPDGGGLGLCADECSREGARACDDGGENGYEVCGNWDNDDCLEWSPVNYCSDRESCDLGVCEAACTDDCTVPGETRCATPPAEGIEVCSDYDDDPCFEWGDAIPCGEGSSCIDGSCGGETECTDECGNPGRQICDGDGTRVCGDHDEDTCLEWSELTECEDECDDGECVECLEEDVPCENYDDCCECLHCCPVLHICVPDWWDGDC